MFPVGEFNFVVAGLATFAATVGYACTRRLSASAPPTHRHVPFTTKMSPHPDALLAPAAPFPSEPASTSASALDDAESAMLVDHDGDAVFEDAEPSASAQDAPQSDHHDHNLAAAGSSPQPTIDHSERPASAPARRESLKRKVPHDGFDEHDEEKLGYPHNLANIYPNKRSRTPSSDSIQSETPSADHVTAAAHDAPTPPAPVVDDDVHIPMITAEPQPMTESDPQPVMEAEAAAHPIASTLTAGTCTSINAPTPASEPPLSPSPPPEVEAEAALTPTPAPAAAAPTEDEPSAPPAPLAEARPATPVVEARPTTPVVDERPTTPAPTTPKPSAHPAFGTALSRPATPSTAPSTHAGTSTTTPGAPNPFAAFAGRASPFAAYSPSSSAFATTSSSASPFGKSTASPFSSSTAGAFGGGTASPFSNTSSTASPFASAAGAGRAFFSLAPTPTTTPTAQPVWGARAGADLKTHANEPGAVLALAAGGERGTASADAEKEAEAAAAQMDAEKETEKTVAESETERAAREDEEKTRAAARAREEAEVREQERREKQARKEYKRREREAGHALVGARATAAHPVEGHTPVTGEEDEDVELEQKGVRLFVKRGARPFSEGIAGHIKLLAHRTTLEERILFRREPLWKVSMNVRVQPAVRATFVPEEHVLRFILKESVPAEDGGAEGGAEAKQEVAIYVVKPGRNCPKQDFKEFAESLVASAQFKAGAEGARKARQA